MVVEALVLCWPEERHSVKGRWARGDFLLMKDLASSGIKYVPVRGNSMREGKIRKGSLAQEINLHSLKDCDMKGGISNLYMGCLRRFPI